MDQRAQNSLLVRRSWCSYAAQEKYRGSGDSTATTEALASTHTDEIMRFSTPCSCSLLLG